MGEHRTAVRVKQDHPCGEKISVGPEITPGGTEQSYSWRQPGIQDFRNGGGGGGE